MVRNLKSVYIYKERERDDWFEEGRIWNTVESSVLAGGVREGEMKVLVAETSEE